MVPYGDIMPTPDQVLVITPNDQLKFTGPSTDVVSTEITLNNPSDGPVAFKVKTTAPRRYAVRPNSGVIQSGETIRVTVMRQPYDQDANEKGRHRFMIQSVRIQNDQPVATIWQDVDSAQIMDTRLTVVFDGQQHTSRLSINEDDYYKVRDDNDRLSKELDDLKEERNRLRSLALSAPSANDARKKLPQGISLLFHEKKNLVLILVLLVLCFISGILLADSILILADNKPVQ